MRRHGTRAPHDYKIELLLPRVRLQWYICIQLAVTVQAKLRLAKTTNRYGALVGCDLLTDLLHCCTSGQSLRGRTISLKHWAYLKFSRTLRISQAMNSAVRLVKYPAGDAID